VKVRVTSAEPIGAAHARDAMCRIIPTRCDALFSCRPAHAAAEIERVIKAVREEKMPYEDWGDPAHLDPAIRAALLECAARFQAVVAQARTWEKQHQRSAGDRESVGQSVEPKGE
jgi:hypothetical protein